ncbi:MAG: DUF599 family protein, partial [Candidatus Hermodarchaeota archaeon]
MHEIAIFIFVICVFLYGIMLLYGLKRPLTIRRGMITAIYNNWVDVILKEDGSTIVGIQAIRNMLMGASIFISALLVLLGVLIGLYSIIGTEEYLFLGIFTLKLSYVQIGLIILVIIFSLFNFVFSVRMAIRLTFFISAEPQKLSLGLYDAVQQTKSTLISLQNHWMFGIRGLFYLV